jgi:tRNA (cytidine/uridine-2'-O-)-methyltransferase
MVDALEGPRMFAFTTKAKRFYHEVAYRTGDVLLFGPETRGLPAEVLEALPPEQRLRIPMRAGARSLNLSNSAAVAVYEAWRQTGFSGAAGKSP